MSLLISEAWAQGAAASAESGFISFLPLIIIFVVFYLLLIRPQMKRAKEHKKMVETLAKGDEVVTSGGLLGRITEIGDNFIGLEIAEGVLVKVQKPAVTAMVPKGTMKSTI
jgi:preprotein translocase subunit YajC